MISSVMKSGPWPRSPGEDEGGVVAPEAERGLDGGVERGGPGLLAHHVDGDVRVGGVEVDGGRYELVLEGEDGERGLDAAGRAEGVAGHRLGGGDEGVLAEDAAEHDRLDQVVGDGGGAVGVDVA